MVESAPSPSVGSDKTPSIETVPEAELPKTKKETRPKARGEQLSPDQYKTWLENQQANKPVKATKPKRSKEKPPPPDMPKRGEITEALTGMYTGIGFMLTPFDGVCGQAVMEAGPKCAESLEDLAKTNPAVRKAIMGLIKTSAWGTVIAAHAPIVMAILSHHGPGARNEQQDGILRTPQNDNAYGEGDPAKAWNGATTR